MNFGLVPIFWISRLQTEIALSTLDANHIYLSQGIRELVSARNLVLELNKNTGLDLTGTGLVHMVWEIMLTPRI